MKCNDVKAFLSQISGKCVTQVLSKENLNPLVRNGFIQYLSKDEYEQLAASVANLSKIQGELEQEEAKERVDEETLKHDQKKVHSIRFWFEGRDKKEFDREKVQTDQQVVSQDEAEIHEEEDEVQGLIQKKSLFDLQVACGDQYVSLTPKGVAVLHELTICGYRVGEKDFADFLVETQSTEKALQSIAERAGQYYSDIKSAVSNMDASPLATQQNDNDDDDDDDDDDDEDDDEDDDNEDDYRIKTKGTSSSQLWAVSIGLAKLEGGFDEIKNSFIETVNILNSLEKTRNSNLDSKLMAAEALVASGHSMSVSQINEQADLDNIARQLIDDCKVPEELATGIATTLYCGANQTDALTRFKEHFSKATKSYVAAAMLSTSKESEDELQQGFEGFKSIFDGWGYSPSEDTDVAAAYLTLSKLNIVRPKMNAILEAIKGEFEFPLVPVAILTTMPLEPDELVELAEKAASTLQAQPLATGLSHSELANLAIRMIYGH